MLKSDRIILCIVLLVFTLLVASVVIRNNMPFEPWGYTKKIISDEPVYEYLITYNQGGNAFSRKIPPLPAGHPILKDINEYAYELVKNQIGSDLPEDYKDYVQITSYLVSEMKAQ
ncbi:hypothetical protein U6B65_10680 [Oscillospiraceae bacterium MB08-C2-2]|nr:hypothetical protein U6B65_10680 [Oscillospiraceae bacterium MB08-C2-2]